MPRKNELDNIYTYIDERFHSFFKIGIKKLIKTIYAPSFKSTRTKIAI